jgi:DNA-binding transcriptional MerR regulator
MQKFTIRDIENMCGIKAHTLRIWEQRYDFFKPKRKQSKHRIYDNEDLKQLLRVAFLYHQGWKVSKIAVLSQEEILETVRLLEKQTVEQKSFILTLLEAAIAFDEKSFNDTLNDCIIKFGLEDAVLNICFPLMNRMGMLWMTNNIIPAQEHFSSYLIQHKIIAETQKLPVGEKSNPVILLFTPDGEHHELPLLFINYLLRSNRVHTVYIGTNIKFEHVKLLLQQDLSIQMIYFHSITHFSKYDIDDYLELLCTHFPEKKVIASGTSIQPATRTFLNLRLLKSDESIKKFVKNVTAILE